VTGAYFVMFPYSRIITLVPLPFLFTLMEVPAFLFLGLWFLWQFLAGTFCLDLGSNCIGVAWWAHVGGFLLGATLHPLFLPRRWSSWR